MPEVRKLFGGFHIQGVELHYTSQKVAERRYKEVLITNYTGATVTPSTLNAGDEWFVVGVVGNRGALDAGEYLSTTTIPGVESAAVVMVWNTVDSPGAELPALSNLDVNDTNPIYDSDIMRHASYDVVGFRLNVQNVFNGIIAALTQAGLAPWERSIWCIALSCRK